MEEVPFGLFVVDVAVVVVVVGVVAVVVVVVVVFPRWSRCQLRQTTATRLDSS